jgi:hypothetical protein
MHLEAVVGSVEMHKKAMIERVWTCKGRLRSSEVRDRLGSYNRGCWEIHFEALIDHD